MKKLFALVMVFCLAFAAVSALAEAPEAKAFDSGWVAADGEWNIIVDNEDDGLRVRVVHRLEGKSDVWEYSGNVVDGVLTTVPMGLHYTEVDNVESTENTYEDGEAEFSINEAGQLVWKDLKEDAGKDLAFDKVGSFFGTRWVKGEDLEVNFYDWYEGQYDIRIYQYGKDGEVLKDGILKGDYDAASDTITAAGDFNDADVTITFSHDAENNVIWTENGESTTLKISTFTE